MAFTAFTIIQVAPVKAEWNHPMPKEWYLDLARCETGNNIKHETLSYVSAFGIHRQTWRKWGSVSPAKAKTLTFQEQAQVVDRIAFTGKKRIKADGTKEIVVFPVGPFGWGAIKRNCNNLATRLCLSKNKIVRYWHYRCAPYIK